MSMALALVMTFSATTNKIKQQKGRKEIKFPSCFFYAYFHLIFPLKYLLNYLNLSPSFLIEGFIPAQKLDTESDAFYFEESLLSYISDDGTKTYTFGTPVKVQVVDVNMDKQEILFYPVNETASK